MSMKCSTRFFKKKMSTFNFTIVVSLKLLFSIIIKLSFEEK